MTSELRVDNLKGSTTGATGGSINVLGEGTSVTTNLQQGLCKAWVQFDGTDSSASARDSFNVSGITDGGTGKTTVSINNDMANDDWAGVLYQSGYGSDGFDNHYAGGLESKTTGSILVTAYASSLIDAFMCDLIVMGDLA